jgi:hypothetical protein
MSGVTPGFQHPPPPIRRLRVYAFDPQFSGASDTAELNLTTLQLPWEAPWEAKLEPGPTNDYLEVMDIDPASGQFYRPVDLNDGSLLAQDGLTPSEGNPQFHQQMVFGVAMKTIRSFEAALGRRVVWTQRYNTVTGHYEAVPRLRIYPHALREKNAYYSPQRRALLFGYFRSTASRTAATPAGHWVFTALSHDIITHETTHAILDGLHRRLAERTSLDSAAFHEAIADLVAIFTRATNPVLVGHVLARNRGRLDNSNLLTAIGRQYGEARGMEAALRDAWDADETAKLAEEAAAKGEVLPPALDRARDPRKPHLRGAVLVAAVYAAFVSIYHRRAGDLLSLAARMGGDSLDPVILKRLTSEAVMIAGQVLNMSLRALDYLPPVDVTFGEYLRAIISADMDLVPHDPHHYRLAFIEAFRKRGIVPSDCLSLAPENLAFEGPEDADIKAEDLVKPKRTGRSLDLEPRFAREEATAQAEQNRFLVHQWLMQTDMEAASDLAWEKALGVFFVPNRIGRKPAPATIVRSKTGPIMPTTAEALAVEVHSVRLARRAGPDGEDLRQLIVQVTQRRRGYFDPAVQAAQDAGAAEVPPDFWFRGGATLIIDLREGNSGTIRRVIRKAIDDDARLAAQRRHLIGGDSFGMTYGEAPAASGEPFAIAHRH